MGKKDPGDDPDPSHARDHLANERTYLAWPRTSANVMALGLAVAKFVEVSRTGAAGAVLTVALAVALLLLW